MTAAPLPASQPRRLWPWWLALFDAAGITVLATVLGGLFVRPIAGPLVRSFLPDFAGTMGETWAAWLLALAAAQVFQIYLLLGLIAARAPSATMLPWRPLLPAWRRVLAISAVAFALQIAGASLALWRFPDAMAQDDQVFRFLMRSPLAGVTLLTGVGLAPLAEEMLFRGFLLSALAGSRIGFAGAGIVTSALWAAVHFYSLPGTLLVFGVGLLFAFLVGRTGSLLPGIVLHALYNLGALLGLALQ